MRVLASLLGASAVLAAVTLGAARDPVVARAPTPVLSCKPQGPVELSLVQVASSGARAELAWQLRPVRELLSVAWELQLPDDAALLEGARAGEAATAADLSSGGALVVDLPQDDRARRARLVVRGTFAGSGPDGVVYAEPFEVSTSLHWGQPEADAPRRSTVDAEQPAAVEVIALPVAHRMGG